LPAPTHVFIGGSGGNLSTILGAVLQKNPAVRIVMSAVTLETLAEATELLKTLPVQDAEIVQLSVSRSQSLGKYHLLAAQNPVFLFSFQGAGDRFP
ncbi:MAG: bifunctional cobalt-precorrin-7 (C(5))-methyltransferase/cobalt-precorrin-6B (C(15))-methyltransferase, partial [bacterium]